MTQVEALGEWTAETTLAQDDNVSTNCKDNHIYMELLHFNLNNQPTILKNESPIWLKSMTRLIAAYDKASRLL